MDSIITKEKTNVVYFIIIGFMGFLTIFTIAQALKNHSFTNTFAFTNSVADIIGLVFLVMLFGLSFSKSRNTNQSMLSFRLLIIHVFFVVFFSTLANICYGMSDCVEKMTVLKTISAVFAISFYLDLWIYQKRFFRLLRKANIVTVLISSIVVFYTAILIFNIFNPVIFVFSEHGYYSYGSFKYLDIIVNALCITVLYIVIIVSRIDLKKKLSFASCILMPAVGMMMSLFNRMLSLYMYMPCISDIALILPLFIIFLNIHIERENKIILYEKEQIRLQVAASMSQIQPHFLYNSLSVIAVLCTENPPLAARATVTFSDYLRKSMDFANKSDPILFSEELDHIKSYVSLEELRFPDRLKIEYDINCTDFFVPPLSIQPLIENAIKHGICKSSKGGTVKIISDVTEMHYIVTITDDGVGFDPEKPFGDGRQHIGINSSRFRIEKMLGGRLKIESAPGEGTTVTAFIPKERTLS